MIGRRPVAKRITNSCDNTQSMEHGKFRIDETTNEKFVAVTDPDALAKLCEIADSLGGDICSKVVSETISALQLVRLDNPTDVSIATSNGTCPDATVFGMARTAATVGNNVEIVRSGKVYDSSFTFPVNDPLFLGVNGVITNVAPATGFLTQIGYSGGPGLIILEITDPIML